MERSHSILHFISCWLHLGFRRIISKCGNGPSAKALRDAVIHACVGVEVISRGPGDHWSSGNGGERSETTM